MKNIILFLLFYDVCSAVKHSFTFFCTASIGIPDVPQFMVFSDIDGIQAASCNSNKTNLELKTDAGRRFLNDRPDVRDLLTQSCFHIQPHRTAALLQNLMQVYNQIGGVHVLQSIEGCEWDENTGEVEAFYRYGYDGDDLVSLDLKNKMWIALKPQADIVKQMMDTDEIRIKEEVFYLTNLYPNWLKTYLSYEKTSTLQTVPPSVSLLQKSPSSPVSCHATGINTTKIRMFWRKDGEEIHEDVDHGEILPNHDGTFQMRVDLNVSSVKDEDWSRYDCVFQISGVKDDIITKLDKAGIRTNKDVSTSAVLAPVIFVIVVVLLLLVVAIAVILEARQKRKNRFRPVNKPASEMLTDYGDRFVYLENSPTHEATRTTTTTTKKKKRLRFKF